MMDFYELKALQEAFYKCTTGKRYMFETENDAKVEEIDNEVETIEIETPETDENEVQQETEASVQDKIQQLLDCPEMEAAHEFLYDIDYDTITDKQIEKVKKLFDLAVKNEFITVETEEDEVADSEETNTEETDTEEPVEDEEGAESAESKDNIETTNDEESVEDDNEMEASTDDSEGDDTADEEPVEEEPANDEPEENIPAEENDEEVETSDESPEDETEETIDDEEENILDDVEESSELEIDVDPDITSSAFTCLYSAMKDGEIKTGEFYSNAVDPASAKVDAISKLIGLGFTSIEIIAVENGDPADIGKSNVTFDSAETAAEPCDDCPPFPVATAENLNESEDDETEEEVEIKDKVEEKPESKEEEEKKEDTPSKEEEETEEKEEAKDDDKLSKEEKDVLKLDFEKLWKDILKSFEVESFSDFSMKEKAAFWEQLDTKWQSEYDPTEFLTPDEVCKFELIKITL